MSNEINISSLYKGFHFGSISGYEILKYSWFEKKEFDDNNYLYKAFINDIKYDPDEIYLKNDGCWIAEIFDTENVKTEMYRFRNFIDLVEVFDKKGYRFCRSVEVKK